MRLAEVAFADESATVVEDRGSGRSKGFGFLEMSSDGEAQGAISALNRHSLDGRSITVNEAKPRPAAGGRRDRRW